jgi:hypothetical protein
MFSFIESVYNVFLDKTRTLSFKFAVFICIVGSAFAIDYCFNITYNSHLTNKLNNLEKVNNLKLIYSEDSIQLNMLNEIEHELLSSKHYIDVLLYRVSDINFNELKESLITSSIKEIKSTKIENKNEPNKIEVIKKNKSIRSRFWMFVSSNFFIILIFIAFLFSPLSSKENIRVDFMVAWAAILILLICFMLGVTWTSYFIPVLFGNAIYNYILNFIINSLLTGLFFQLLLGNKK